MERERLAVPALIAAGAVTLAASAFAVGAAMSSDNAGDDGAGADESAATAATAATAPSDSQVPEASARATASSATAPVATATGRFDVEIAAFRFGPQDAVVQVGTEVVWTNNDTDVHSVISADERFASSDEFANGETYAVVFSEPGTYEYSCGVHPSMTGSITVEA